MPPNPAHSQSPSRRARQRFRRNRLGFASLVVFCTLVLVSLVAELVSNDRPLVVVYQGQIYWPMVRDYPETTFGGDLDRKSTRLNSSHSQISYAVLCLKTKQDAA